MPHWLPGWDVALVAWVPVDAPRPKGNSKLVLLLRGGRRVPKGDAREEAQERAIRAALRVLAPAPAWPVSGEVVLDVEAHLPFPALTAEHGVAWRARALRGDADHGPTEPGDPDTGNLLKMLEDAAKGSLVVDDVTIRGGWRDKRYSTSPGWWVRVCVRATRAVGGGG